MGEIFTCLLCGRDTQSKTELCVRCREHQSRVTDEYKDRSVNSVQRMESMGFTDMHAQADDEGWPYEDGEDEL